MLRILFSHIPRYPVKYFLSILYAFLLFDNSWAATQNYRLILTENPATSIHLGWELIGGCPDLQRIYYDTIDHGQDTASYAMKASITASNFHQGMENYFCHLKNLLPGTKYYLVIGEDDGISPRLIAETFSTDGKVWRGGWTTVSSPDWPAIFQLINRDSVDFMLLDGLAALSTEDMWRNFLDSWQPATYEKTLTPIIATNASLPDIQYLFNTDKKRPRSYQMNQEIILLVSDATDKISKRYWKSVSNAAQVIWCSFGTPKKISEKADLVLTSNAHHEDLPPNVFNFPKQQSAVILEQQSDRLRITSVDNSVLMELFFN